MLNTQQHRDNLEKLGRYLCKLTAQHNFAHFNMRLFVDHRGKIATPGREDEIKKIYEDCFCGTVACAIGHAPLAMPEEFKAATKKMIQDLRKEEDRLHYGEGFFSNNTNTQWRSLSKYLFDIDIDVNTAWHWLFGEKWGTRYIDDYKYFNTSWAAADRMAFLLYEYDREEYSYLDQNPYAEYTDKARGAAIRAGWITKRSYQNKLTTYAKKVMA